MTDGRMLQAKGLVYQIMELETELTRLVDSMKLSTRKEYTKWILNHYKKTAEKRSKSSYLHLLNIDINMKYLFRMNQEPLKTEKS